MFLIRFFSLLPFWLIYALAELLAFLAYYVIRYRKKVVRENLLKCFPEKKLKEIKKIERQFYRHFIQVIFEIAKSYRLDSNQLEKRSKLLNKEEVLKYLDEGTSVITLAAHHGNWEWVAASLSSHMGYTFDFLYKKVKSNSFDEIMLHLRRKHNGNPIEKDKAMRQIVKNRHEARLIGIAADQTPSIGAEKVWVNYFDQETAFYRSAERIATSFKYAIFYLDTVRVKRGHYETTFRKVAEAPFSDEPGRIIADYSALLERSIRGNPSEYLWSHRRWKFTKEEAQAETGKPYLFVS